MEMPAENNIIYRDKLLSNLGPTYINVNESAIVSFKSRKILTLTQKYVPKKEKHFNRFYLIDANGMESYKNLL
jgi:hypothetical protein